MPTPAYIFPTLDGEPIVPTLSDFLPKTASTTLTETEAKSSSIMDHQNTSTTLRTSAKKPTAEDELEELALDSLISVKSRDLTDLNKDQYIEEEAQTLNKRDYGNFALLVTLCKL
jgi:hypothetical protein